MKKYPTFSLLLILPALAVGYAPAQSNAAQPSTTARPSSPSSPSSASSSATRPRTVTQSQPQPSPSPTTQPQQQTRQQPPPLTVPGRSAATPAPPASQTQSTVAPVNPGATVPQALPPATSTLPAYGDGAANPAQTPAHQLSLLKARSRILEAQRLLKSRPVQTALSTPGLYTVTLAALDPETSQIHLLTLPKETFLTKGAEVPVITSLGRSVQLRVLRANGVNTAVTVFDAAGRSLTPLVVEFPIERNGAFREMAYYTSAHPALLSPDVVRAGQTYVHNMIELAAKRLREKGLNIAPNILDEAEHLCIVEHVDHDRFRKENRLALYEEIYSLYALNELDTYRYSVSTAGAGGMVQMIPWTYQMIRQRHPGAGLNPDFVSGMRNHGNALEAMLLYMQDTWSELSGDPDVTNALLTKTATPAELMAAGYNSNPARLPQYLRRGGESWKVLIPRETQMYLQIYRSFDSLVAIKPRS
jgi:hypothetical protein